MLFYWRKINAHQSDSNNYISSQLGIAVLILIALIYWLYIMIALIYWFYMINVIGGPLSSVFFKAIPHNDSAFSRSALRCCSLQNLRKSPSDLFPRMHRQTADTILDCLCNLWCPPIVQCFDEKDFFKEFSGTNFCRFLILKKFAALILADMNKVRKN